MNHHSRHGGRRTRNWLWRKRGVVGAMVGLALAAAGAGELDPRGGQFIGFARFSAFAPSAGELPGEEVLTSPELAARIHWDELVASWNAEMPEGAYLKVEARALYPRRAT